MVSSLLLQAVETSQRIKPCTPFLSVLSLCVSSLVSLPALAMFCRNTIEQDRPLLPGPELGGEDIY